jgi:hypothetical protein
MRRTQVTKKGTPVNPQKKIFVVTMALTLGTNALSTHRAKIIT